MPELLPNIHMEKASIKASYDQFKPESVVFVITVDEKEKPAGMVAGWNMKASMDPPMFAVPLSKKYHTHKLIRKRKQFVIAVANKSLEDEVRFFGSTHGNEVDKFKETGIETVPSQFIKPPLIKKATVNFECELVSETDAGDHIIFLGKILASYINSEKKTLFNVKTIKGERVFGEFPK